MPIIFYGDIPCTRNLTPKEIQVDYEKNTGLVIVEEFMRRKLSAYAIPSVIISGHAPFSWGKNAMEAVSNAVVLEEVFGNGISDARVKQWYSFTTGIIRKTLQT